MRRAEENTAMMGEAVLQAMVATAQPDRARAFYQDTLGLKLIRENQFGMEFAGKIGFLRVAKIQAVAPSLITAAGFMVESVEATADALAAKGVQLERFAFLQHDAKGLWAAPDGAKVGWFRDPDLNLLSITQFQ
jgi:catechol 2,3-dioxygenase-like lactoylglutathione lyase family enzyme